MSYLGAPGKGGATGDTGASGYVGYPHSKVNETGTEVNVYNYSSHAHTFLEMFGNDCF